MNNLGLENNTTEFKAELTKKLEKETVAFLNSKKGGDIYIGVDDCGCIIGVQNPDSAITFLKFVFLLMTSPLQSPLK